MSDLRDPETDQPLPIPNDQVSTFVLVKQDLDARCAQGIRKYGVAHQPFNGRNNLLDAYQEALDMVIYLRAAIEERQSVLYE